MKKSIGVVLMFTLITPALQAQTALRVGVLEIESHVSAQQDLMVTVSNLSKMPARLDNISATMSPGCSFKAAPGEAKPGSVNTIQLASRAQLRDCQLSTLNETLAVGPMRSVRRLDLTPVLRDRTLDRPLDRTIDRTVDRTRPAIDVPAALAKQHAFTISASGSTQGKPFNAQGDWLLQPAQ
jgi:hypothetical protein